MLNKFNWCRVVVLLLFNTFTVFSQQSKGVKTNYAWPMPDSTSMLSPIFITNETPKILAMFRPSINTQMKLTAIASSSLKKGKIYAIGSSAYLDKKMLNLPVIQSFLQNTISASLKPSQKIGLLGPDIANLEMGLGTQYQFYDATVHGIAKETAVIILSKDIVEKSMLEKVEGFVSRGGTLIYASPLGAIHYGDKINNDAEIDLNINKLLLKAGLYNSRNVLFNGRETNKILFTDSIPAYLHPNTLFPWLASTSLDEVDFYIKPFAIEPSLTLVFKNIDVNGKMAKRIASEFNYTDSLIRIDRQHPLKLGSQHNRWGYIFNQLLTKKKLDKITSSVGFNYATFPGSVSPRFPRISKQINLSVKVGKQGLYEPAGSHRQLHSTGLYVPAGERVVVRIADGYLPENIAVQIGVHNDDLTHLDVLTREGVDLTRTFELNKTQMDIFSPYGGLLLINIPDTSKLKNFILDVSGVVEAPYFINNKTTSEQWEKIRNNPGPWAELASDKVILTVPSEKIRNLKNPDQLLRFWDQVMDANAKLANVPINRVHPERIIVDENVAFGYMFTTREKIVVPNDESCELLLDVVKLRNSGSWGHFHEIGHRHQFRKLDFEGLQEISVNLFTLYAYNKVLHKKLFENEKFPNREKMWEYIDTYFNNDPSFLKWKKQPFAALSMYVQLIDEFGWESIENTYKHYRAIPELNYPKTDQQKIDLWFTTICRATKTDLSSFFDIWRIPISKQAKNDALGLKTWLPERMKKYSPK